MKVIEALGERRDPAKNCCSGKSNGLSGNRVIDMERSCPLVYMSRQSLEVGGVLVLGAQH